MQVRDSSDVMSLIFPSLPCDCLIKKRKIGLRDIERKEEKKDKQIERKEEKRKEKHGRPVKDILHHRRVDLLSFNPTT